MPAYGPTAEWPTRSGAVAIIASAGGVPALTELFRALPNDFAPTIFVAQHLARMPSTLDQLLSSSSGKRVVWAAHDEAPKPAHIYVVPPGKALALTTAGIHLERLGPTAASWLRASNDMIESILQRYRDRTIAIALSGMLPAGIQGLRSVKLRGGVTMAQTPASSEFSDMPCGAIDFGKTEIVLPPVRLAKVMQIVAGQWLQ